MGKADHSDFSMVKVKNKQSKTKKSKQQISEIFLHFQGKILNYPKRIIHFKFQKHPFPQGISAINLISNFSPLSQQSPFWHCIFWRAIAMIVRKQGLKHCAIPKKVFLKLHKYLHSALLRKVNFMILFFFLSWNTPKHVKKGWYSCDKFTFECCSLRKRQQAQNTTKHTRRERRAKVTGFDYTDREAGIYNLVFGLCVYCSVR